MTERQRLKTIYDALVIAEVATTGEARHGWKGRPNLAARARLERFAELRAEYAALLNVDNKQGME